MEYRMERPIDQRAIRQAQAAGDWAFVAGEVFMAATNALISQDYLAACCYYQEALGIYAALDRWREAGNICFLLSDVYGLQDHSSAAQRAHQMGNRYHLKAGLAQRAYPDADQHRV